MCDQVLLVLGRSGSFGMAAICETVFAGFPAVPGRAPAITRVADDLSPIAMQQTLVSRPVDLHQCVRLAD